MCEHNNFLNKQLCFLFYVSSKEIIKRYTPHLKKYGLTYTGYIVLLALEDDESINVKSLGKRLFLDSGTLTPMIKKLEKQKLVQRFRQPSDERNLLVSLTEQGVKMRHDISHIALDVFNDLDISTEDAKTIKSILTKFVANNFSEN